MTKSNKQFGHKVGGKRAQLHAPTANDISRKSVNSLEILDEVIIELRQRMVQASELIDRMEWDDEKETALIKLLALHAQSASRVGGLLRDRRAISGDAADSLMALAAQIIDEVGTDLGWQL